MKTEGHDQAWGWEGPVGNLIREAVISGAYRRAIRRDPNRAAAFDKLAVKHEAQVIALCSAIGAAGVLLEQHGIISAPA